MAGFNGARDESVTYEAVPADALGQRAVVVGGTGGIGRALARLMAARGAEVTVVGRTFRDEGVAGLRFMEADLSSLEEASRVGRELDAASSVVVLTTGIFAYPERRETAEGLEVDLAVSYMSRFAILRELAPRMDAGRVFIMGFPGGGNLGDPDDLNSERDYRSMDAHMQTVAANEALVLDAARRWPQVNVYGLNPGLIQTEIRANALGGTGSLRYRIVESLIGLLMPSADRYARRIVPVLFAHGLDGVSGVHFNRKGMPIRPTEGMTEARVRRFMEATDALLARAGRAAQPV